MPELPEVQVVVLGLKDLLIGHTILDVQTDWAKSLRITKTQLRQYVIQFEIKAVRRIGKMIVLDLDSDWSLIVHLKLTGQLVYHQRLNSQKVTIFGAGHPSDSLISNLPDQTTRIIFELNDTSFLFFNDVRKFGWVKLLRTKGLRQSPLMQSIGPDALDVQASEFIELLGSRRKSIKACLLDQSILAGCGNIYADESLWLSKIHPRTPAFKLTSVRLGDLHYHLQAVLNLSISKGGSTSRNYVDALGLKGRYLTFAKVYQKTGSPCQRCKFKIKRIVVAGRGTHICEACQKVSL